MTEDTIISSQIIFLLKDWHL